MRNFLFLLALLQVSALYAQDKIYEVKKPKRGIYSTFAEFQSNSPSLPLKTQIIKSLSTKAEGVSGQPFTLNLSKKEAKEIGKVFGFSNGTAVYMNPSGARPHEKARFYKITYLFSTAIYEIEKCNNAPIPTTDGMVITSANTDRSLRDCKNIPFYININSGMRGQLNTFELRELIRSANPNLLEEYDEDLDKEERWEYYYVKSMVNKERD